MEPEKQFAGTGHANIYCRYRRDSPQVLTEKIISTLKEKYDGPLNFAVDVGCGSGQSTVNLAPFFKKVHGIDVAEAQIEKAKATRALPNVTYSVGPAETIPFEDGSAQIVTAGAALHWFNLESFFPEVRRVLCNNGILAVYCYFSFKPLLDNPTLTEKVDKVWNEVYEITADYHSPPAKIAYDLYRNVDFPFEEVLRFNDVREIFDGELSDIIGYLSTFSGFQNFKKKDEKKATELLSDVEQRFRAILKESNLNADGPLKLYRDFCLIICRKIVKDS